MMIDGVKIAMGGAEYVVPPLNFRQIRTLEPILAAISTGMDQGISGERMDQILTVIHASLSRNYPDISKETLEEQIDLGNLPHILQAVMGVSGLKKGGVVPGSP